MENPDEDPEPAAGQEEPTVENPKPEPAAGQEEPTETENPNPITEPAAGLGQEEPTGTENTQTGQEESNAAQVGRVKVDVAARCKENLGLILKDPGLSDCRPVGHSKPGFSWDDFSQQSHCCTQARVTYTRMF